MGLLAHVRDPRLQPWAYVSRGRRFYEVISVRGASVTLENALTEHRTTTTIAAVLRDFKLERAAPIATDTPIPMPDLDAEFGLGAQ